MRFLVKISGVWSQLQCKKRNKNKLKGVSPTAKSRRQNHPEKPGTMRNHAPAHTKSSRTIWNHPETCNVSPNLWTHIETLAGMSGTTRNQPEPARTRTGSRTEPLSGLRPLTNPTLFVKKKSSGDSGIQAMFGCLTKWGACNKSLYITYHCFAPHASLVARQGKKCDWPPDTREGELLTSLDKTVFPFDSPYK